MRTRVNESMLWHRTADMAMLKHRGLHLGYDIKMLEPLFVRHKFLLPWRQLRKSISYRGSLERLRAHLHHALRGGPSAALNVGLVGGSASVGHDASLIGITDFFSVFARWLAQSLNKVATSFHNGASAATHSSFMELCMSSHVDPEVQLMFVEYNMNDFVLDSVSNNTSVQDVERLVRKLMDLPRGPAVVLLQLPPIGVAQYPENRTLWPHTYRPFHESNEELYGAVAQYYDLPALSMRTALYDVSAHQRAEGFRWTQLFTNVHPGDSGYHVVADMMVFLLQEVVTDLLLYPYPGPGEGGHVEEGPGGWSAASSQAQPSNPSSGVRGLPPPMHAGNVPDEHAMCVIGNKLPSLVVSSDGWNLVDEGKQRLPKWGYVSAQPGSVLRINLSAVSSTLLGAPPAEPQQQTRASAPSSASSGGSGGHRAMYLHLLHLKSYMHMGRAELRCVSGCMCSSSTINAMNPSPSDRTSQVYIYSTAITPSRTCIFEVQVLEATSSNGHKFKVTGVAITSSQYMGTGTPMNKHEYKTLLGFGRIDSLDPYAARPEFVTAIIKGKQ